MVYWGGFCVVEFSYETDNFLRLLPLLWRFWWVLWMGPIVKCFTGVFCVTVVSFMCVCVFLCHSCLFNVCLWVFLCHGWVFHVYLCLLLWYSCVFHVCFLFVFVLQLCLKRVFVWVFVLQLCLTGVCVLQVLYVLNVCLRFIEFSCSSSTLSPG